MNVFAPDEAPAQEAGWLVIELLGDFLADQAPLRGLRFHRLGIDHLLDHGQVFRETLSAGFSRSRRLR